MHPPVRRHRTFTTVALVIAAAFFSEHRIAHAAPPSLPPNPAVQQIVDAVSPTGIQSDIEALVGFYTRNVNSDTTSASIGIGAARNWALGRFQQISQETGNRLEPSFFVFDTTICSRFYRHKNVIAKLPGLLAPGRHFIVSGHIDSRTIGLCDVTSFAPGADDDGSGVVVALEMARVMSSHNFDASMIFMNVTGEEQGLFGSTAYAKWALAHGMRIDGMITNDIVGGIVGCIDPACPGGEQDLITDSTSVRHFSLGPATSKHRQFTRAMKLAAARYVPGFTVNLVPAHDRPGRAGDHFPFDARGYTAARFTEAHENGDGSGTNGHQHNGTDLIDYMNMSYVAKIAMINAAGFANLLLAPETPVSPTVENVGNGTLRLTWPSVLTAADVAGYRVALRGTAADSLHYFDIRDAGLDPGPVQEFILDGLQAGFSIYVSVSAYDTDRNESIFSGEVLATPVVTAAAEGTVARSSGLAPLSPNPSKGNAVISFDLARPGFVSIKAFDLSGRFVGMALAQRFGSGSWRFSWSGLDQEGRSLPAGVYIIRMSVDGIGIDSERLIRLAD